MSKTIGLIGGMGPAATVDLFARLVRATPAARDQDHLRIVIDNNPRLPDRNRALAGEGPSPGPALGEIAASLERMGADCIIMSCNTAHAFQADIEAAIKVPFFSMIDAAVDATMARRPKRVAMLVADGGRRAGLYQKAFAATGAEPILLSEDDQHAFMSLIYGVKAGETGDVARAEMKRLARKLTAEGADALVAGCTEIPLLLSPHDVDIPMIDAADALVARTLAFAREA